MITASLVLYSYNCQDLCLLKFKVLSSLLIELLNTTKIKFVLIVDNSPQPYFRDLIPESPKFIYHFTHGVNLGFGRAHNLSSSLLPTSNYHIFLNPDISGINDSLITRLLNYCIDNPSTTLVQPLIRDYRSKDIQYLCKLNPSLLSQFVRFVPLLLRFKFFDTYNKNFEMRGLAYMDEITTSTYLSGCFMFCNTYALSKIGWFDTAYFMYLEDADLTRSLSSLGPCVHFPASCIFHVWDRGSHKKLPLTYHAIRSFIIYSIKWGLKLF